MTDQFRVVGSTWIIAAAFLWTFPVAAHHSTAMFDMTKTVTLQGAIKSFHWTNPHCSFDVVASGPNGDEEWSVKLGPPTRLYREDWKPLKFKPGDAIMVVFHPMRNDIHRELLVTDTINGRKDPGADAS